MTDIDKLIERLEAGAERKADDCNHANNYDPQNIARKQDYVEWEAAQALRELRVQSKIEAAGWRCCIDHIIKPESPCPICKVEKLQTRIEELENRIDVYAEDVCLKQAKRIEELEEAIDKIVEACGDAALLRVKALAEDDDGKD
jgi:hypothetical protein